MMVSGLKVMSQSTLLKVCVLFGLLFLLSGCLTIHNLNVRSGGDPGEPVAISTMDGVDEGGQVRQPVPITDINAVDAPPPLSLSSGTPVYTIQPGDELDVKFYYNNDLNETVTVRPDGRISLQLIHDVQAASLSPNELVSVLGRKYASHLMNPEISIILRSMQTHKVFVDGEVKTAGNVELLGNMSILQSIASAGGMKDTARVGDIILIRRNGLKKPFVYTVNVAAALDGSDISQDVMLKPYDIVYVPKSAIANVNVWVDQYIRRNIPINVNMDTITIK
jgi:protein involved in polysaccharide export with SLBB domain